MESRKIDGSILMNGRVNRRMIREAIATAGNIDPETINLSIDYIEGGAPKHIVVTFPEGPSKPEIEKALRRLEIDEQADDFHIARQKKAPPDWYTVSQLRFKTIEASLDQIKTRLEAIEKKTPKEAGK